MQRLLLCLLVLLSVKLGAEEIKYEIYEIDSKGLDTLVAQGSRTYSIKDVQQKSRGTGQVIYYVSLEKAYGVGVVLTPEDDITGFAMLAVHENGGFSWDWFNLKSNNVFEKLQECGMVEVKTTGLPGARLIKSVDFLSDTCLRLNQSEKPGKHTHKIKVKSGSHLVVLP